MNGLQLSIKKCLQGSFFLLYLFALFSTPALAQEIYIDPSDGVYGVGDTIVASIRIDPKDVCVNAVDVDLKYPTDVLRLADFGRGQSILTLWVETPAIQGNPGVVSFSGGMPGGYCGRIPGDPALSNILGKAVFTVLKSGTASIVVSDASRAYQSDGLGTEIDLSGRVATYTLQSSPTQIENPWLLEINRDEIPPEPFEIEVNAERGFLSDTYYLVFSTVDKQSGVDYYEFYEKGGWKIIESPFQLRNLFQLKNFENFELRAVDKSGNVRLGSFNQDSFPSFGFSLLDYVLLLIGLLTLLGLGYLYYTHTKVKEKEKEGSSIDLNV